MWNLVLAIDIGNSTTDIGLFGPEGTLRFRAALATERNATSDQCAMNLISLFALYRAEEGAVSGAILSSVVPSLTANMCRAVERLTGRLPLLIGPGVKTGLNVKADLHDQLGSDIVACCVAALSAYPSPLIVIDMGTAVSMSYLRNNSYEGCVIMPGVQVALEALSEQAAALPHISIEPPAHILGHNTVDAMRSGVVYGNASMIDGMIQRLEAESAPVCAVVATGRSSPEVLKHCKREILYDADLLLRGLYLIYQKNTADKKKKT